MKIKTKLLDEIYELKKGLPVVGTFIFGCDPKIIEILAYSGLDFVIIDTEHTLLSTEKIDLLIATAKSCKILSFVRIKSSEMSMIPKVLDAGADGIIVPHIEEPKQAEDLVKMCNYPPIGYRSMCSGVRASKYGHGYDKSSPIIGCIIESRRGIDGITEIAQVEGISFILIGPRDLSLDLGFNGQYNNQVVQEVIGRAFSLISQSNIFPMMYTSNSEETLFWMQRGVKGIAYSIDLRVLGQSYSNYLKLLNN